MGSLFGVPDECPVCGAPHAACTTDSGPITVTQLPMRDAMATTQPGWSHAPAAPSDPKDETTGPASTKEYRRKERK